MKKKVLIAILMLLALAVLNTTIVLALDSYGDAMAKRGGRGVLNVVKSPFDLINTMEDIRFKEGMLPAMTYGVFKGVGTAIARAFYGLYEVGTFYDTEKNDKTFPVQYDSAFIRI